MSSYVTLRRAGGYFFDGMFWYNQLLTGKPSSKQFRLKPTCSSLTKTQHHDTWGELYAHSLETGLWCNCTFCKAQLGSYCGALVSSNLQGDREDVLSEEPVQGEWKNLTSTIVLSTPWSVIYKEANAFDLFFSDLCCLLVAYAFFQTFFNFYFSVLHPPPPPPHQIPRFLILQSSWGNSAVRKLW